MIRNNVLAFLLPALLMGGCAQIGESDYAISCARTQPDKVRSAIARDLCQQFENRGSVQLYDGGATIACSPAGVPTPKTLVRMFIDSKQPVSLMNGSSVAYIYLLPWKTPVEIIVDTPADDHALAEEVAAAIEQSLGHSNCTWVVHQRHYTDTPKLG